MDPDGEGSAGSRPQVGGVVVERMPSGLYRVRLDHGAVVTAHIADRMDRNFVRILIGDRVRLELSLRDVTRGRIVEKV